MKAVYFVLLVLAVVGMWVIGAQVDAQLGILFAGSKTIAVYIHKAFYILCGLVLGIIGAKVIKQ
jgi:hypothetical protein